MEESGGPLLLLVVVDAVDHVVAGAAVFDVVALDVADGVVARVALVIAIALAAVEVVAAGVAAQHVVAVVALLIVVAAASAEDRVGAAEPTSGFGSSPSTFRRLVLPRIQSVSSSQLAAATGLSPGYCARLSEAANAFRTPGTGQHSNWQGSKARRVTLPSWIHGGLELADHRSGPS